MKKLYYNIGRAFEYNRKWEFAIKFYLKALDPNKSFPYYRLAFCYEKRGDYGNAIYYYKQAIAINRNKPHWYLRIANTYLALQKEGLAAKYLKLGIVKAPNDNHIQKKYRTIRKKLQMGIPEIETFLYSTDFTDTDLEVSIKGNVSPNFNPDHIKLQLKSRPNYLEKDLYTFTCSPIKISSDKDGINTGWGKGTLPR